MPTVTAPTKAQELQALQELAEQLGPSSYLGGWILETLPYLSDCLSRDFIPESAEKMAGDAAIARCDALSEAYKMREEARINAAAMRDLARKEAAAILTDARLQADRIRGNALHAVQRAMQTLEA